MAARQPAIRNEFAAKAQPYDLADERRVRFVQSHQLVAKCAIAREHIDTARRNFRLHEAPIEPPERRRRDTRRQRVAAAGANAERDVDGLGLEHAEKVEDQRLRFLQIRGHHRHVVATRSGEAFAHRGERAKVTREDDQLRGQAARGKRGIESLVRTVRTSIDDEHRFERVVERAVEASDGGDKLGDRRFVAVHRHDQRVFHGPHALHASIT